MRNTIILFFLIFTLQGCNRCVDGCVHGTCIKRLCSCDVWYEGNACERSVLSQHTNSYEGLLEQDTFILDTLVFDLIVSPADPSQMIMHGEGIELNFTDQTRFDVPTQLWKDKKVNGEGEVLVDLFSMRLMFKDSNKQVSALLEAKPHSNE